jgi:hypothetical protein
MPKVGMEGLMDVMDEAGPAGGKGKDQRMTNKLGKEQYKSLG